MTAEGQTFAWLVSVSEVTRDEGRALLKKYGESSVCRYSFAGVYVCVSVCVCVVQSECFMWSMILY